MRISLRKAGFIMNIKPVHVITAAGLAASLLAAGGGCGGSSTSQTAAHKYNVLFVVTDQEHYFAQYPQGTNYRARQILAENGDYF